MVSAERYLSLYDRFGGEQGNDSPVEATLEELSGVLYCTPRNAKLILHKLEEDGLIRWLPGRGRGNRSRIAFKVEKEHFLLELSQGYVAKGNYKQAFEVLHSFGDGTLAMPKFISWLNGQFGYRKEPHGEGLPDCDTLRFPVYSPVFTFDPAAMSYAFDAHLALQIFDRLLRYNEKLSRIEPHLAHHWTSNAEATEWTFYLRKGVHFHNGQELTARDVVFTLERLRGDRPNRWLLRGLERIEMLSLRVVRVYLKCPNRIFERFMCSSASSILPAGLGGLSEDEFWQQPIGTGPFRLIKHSSHYIKLAAYAAYHMGRAYLDGVDVVIMPEECLPAEVNVPEVLYSTLDYVNRREKQGEDWRTLKTMPQGCTLLTWNLNREGIQQSEAFRRAVRMILNNEELVTELGGDRVLPAYGFRPETSQHHMAEPLAPEYVDAALRESQYDGTVIRFSALRKFEEDALWITQRLQQRGIQVELNLYSWNDKINGEYPPPSADLSISRYILAEDEVCEIEAYLQSNSVFGKCFDHDRMCWISSRIDAALSAPDEASRRRRLKEIEEFLQGEASVIFLHHKEVWTYLHPSVRGVSLNTLGWTDFKDIWFENID